MTETLLNINISYTHAALLFGFVVGLFSGYFHAKNKFE
jgi:ABC-type dipeptide/oligopeptide/nickel transport system permease subunit